ncbi:MAG TPA: type I restriction-modification enzyme R subunit C-terminal domain-containing protein, partial [Prevotella sp.]|nr:type I restriction-modification enzyme R subunit C-terminal domain-containing protein [Prevotella sp.]
AILEKKASIPAVMERIDIIRQVQKPVFWENESLDALEHVRRKLRGLVHLLKEQRGGKKFIIDIEDTYTKVEGVEDEVIKTSYKQRVIDYLAENSNNDTLRKIQHFEMLNLAQCIEQLTSADIEELERIFFEELGTKDEYNELTEGHPYKNNVAAFIRVINGIDRKKALQIYQQFIEGYNLTSEQELYLKNILDYISMNGDIETRNFLEYPLKDLKWRETFGDTFVNLKDFIKQMHRVIIA